MLAFHAQSLVMYVGVSLGFMPIAAFPLSANVNLFGGVLYCAIGTGPNRFLTAYDTRLAGVGALV